ncbi:unnamed protein product [Schistocephalus solidus]|uniref:Uncharacterized protein n=1 Tax=Schistocephalus solidus TaxID=70667 RepID=A0A183T0E5_SCHSO|nr:unnamed protein product [Schistocephalus solidus]
MRRRGGGEGGDGGGEGEEKKEDEKEEEKEEEGEKKEEDEPNDSCAKCDGISKLTPVEAGFVGQAGWVCKNCIVCEEVQYEQLST